MEWRYTGCPAGIYYSAKRMNPARNNESAKKCCVEERCGVSFETVVWSEAIDFWEIANGMIFV